MSRTSSSGGAWPGSNARATTHAAGRQSLPEGEPIWTNACSTSSAASMPTNIDQSRSPSTAGADASRGSCSSQSCHSCRASANPPPAAHGHAPSPNDSPSKSSTTSSPQYQRKNTQNRNKAVQAARPGLLTGASRTGLRLAGAGRTGSSPPRGLRPPRSSTHATRSDTAPAPSRACTSTRRAGGRCCAATRRGRRPRAGS